METLIDNGRLGDVAHFPECATFGDLLGAIEALTVDEHSYRTLVIDTLNGAEELCHDAVCKRDFGGKRANDGFAAYGKGPEVALADWRVLLSALDRLRSQRKMSIVCLCHAKIAPFKNPEGEDYDRYRPTLHDKTWGLTLKWSDAALFVNFETFTEKDGLRAKGRGGQQRVMYTERRAAFDSKNRHGLAPEILLGNSAAEAWAAFSAALKEGRATSQN